MMPRFLRVRPLFCLFFFVFSSFYVLKAQEQPTLNYYLPNTVYDKAVPTPAQFLGFEMGAWHVSHDQLLAYLRELARTSPRVQLRQYARTHEQRPLICLTISDTANLNNLESIRTQRLALLDPAKADQVALDKMPAVWYAGYSIHGNETSGSNAALLFAYYLAAADNPELNQFLKNTVVLLDPCFNPDGMQRFSSWVNSRHSKTLSADPAGDEFKEPWPQGRTNHYWFDLNRDWLVMQQPESAGRVAILQDWKPNVLTDHHEMGSNSTFFFQPGVPSRVNPITPARNQELTAKIATYHAKLLSAKKILFFTRENYDDFYYGKGSTYPDVNGGIGILFEQASSRGNAQETDNGLLTFPYTIRNQVFTSFSTMQAIADMRVELNEYLRRFYQENKEAAKQDVIKAYIFGSPLGQEAMAPLLQILDRHHIQWNGLKQEIKLGNTRFVPNKAVIVPLDQAQYRLVKGIFSAPTSFQDSIFYDISAWTLPYAMGLDFAELGIKDFNPALLAEPGFATEVPTQTYDPQASSPFAFAVEWGHPQSPRALAALLNAGIRVKVAMQPFKADNRAFAAGTLLIPADRQATESNLLGQQLKAILPAEIALFTIKNGLTEEGPDLGSSKFPVLRAPKVLMVTGDGINPADAGEIWHLLDTRYGMSMTMIDHDRMANVNLSKYNVLVMPDGAYSLPIEKLREFVAAGGTLIATGDALKWLRSASLITLDVRNAPPDAPGKRLPYGGLDDDLGALRMPGAIFEAQLDLTHPLCFGYTRPTLPMFLADALFIDPSKNPYGNPAVFTANPLLAGYIHPKQKPLVAKSAALAVAGIGKGRVICFPGNPNFRGFWLGTNELFANALFFGNLISSDAAK